MALRGCAVGLCLVLTQAAVAADPPKKLKVPTATAAKPSPVSGRKQLEAKLQMPAKLNFADRKRVTVREVLDQLHQQHQLSLRFDIPTLSAMLDVSSGAAGAYHSPPQTAGGYQTSAGVSPAGYMIPFGSISVLQALSFPPMMASGPCQTACPASSSLSPPPLAPAQAIASATLVAALADDEDDDAFTPSNVPGRASRPEELNESKPQPATPDTKSEISRQLELLYQQDGREMPNMNTDRKSVGSTKKPTALNETETDKQPPATDAAETPPGKATDFQELLAELLDTEIDVQTVDLSRVSIATVLRQALDTAPVAPENSGMPILFTNAMLLDYLVEDDGLLITSRMKALTTKETRVYSIKHLTELPPEQLAKTIRQSIRPWSWRAQINDLGDQLKGSPLPTETLTSILKTGIQLTGAEVSVSPTDENSAEPKKMSAIEEARQMEMLGSAIANGLVTLAQSTLLAMEMVHYAEPPTGTIQTLGTKLVITQSQAAHREIVDLLKQLADE